MGAASPPGPSEGSTSLTIALGSGADTDPSQDSEVWAQLLENGLPPSAGSRRPDTGLEPGRAAHGEGPPESEGTWESGAGQDALLHHLSLCVQLCAKPAHLDYRYTG